jgi:4-amino-4-deoxy-L-arabinose transferase-like glycosyltransferase
VVVAYAALWPRDLYMYDEGLFLYEATRILRGEVIYRDFFEISAPLAHYLLALAFALFGAQLVVARALMAALQAGIAVLIFASMRRLGVRRALAVAATLVDLPLAYIAMSQASPHWFGTALTVALLAALLHPRWRERIGWLGAGVGVLLITQHQKGVVIGAAVAALVALDSLLPRWYRLPVPRLGRQAARYTMGIAAVIVPAATALLAAAGPEHVYAALIRFPLQGYRAYHASRAWGANLLGPTRGVGGELLRWLPAFAALTLVSGLLGAARRRDPETARARLVAGVFGCAVLLSIAYNPDAVHVALIAPLLLVAAAERVEAGLAALERRRGGRVAGALLAPALAAAAVLLLAQTLEFRRSAYPVRGDTRLGPIDFSDTSELQLLDALEKELRGTPIREVFGYPYYASLYLLAGADNPTRFQILIPGYNLPAHFAEAILALETRQTPYVVVLSYFVDWRTDELVRYLDQRYERVPIEGIHPYGPYVLFRRRASHGDDHR